MNISLCYPADIGKNDASEGSNGTNIVPIVVPVVLLFLLIPAVAIVFIFYRRYVLANCNAVVVVVVIVVVVFVVVTAVGLVVASPLPEGLFVIFFFITNGVSHGVQQKLKKCCGIRLLITHFVFN